MMGACPSRALPLGGWYRDGRGRWVHVEVKVIISDGCDNGLRGEGAMVATNVLAASFAHRPNTQLRGEVGPNGEISGDNGQTWEYAASGALRPRRECEEAGAQEHHGSCKTSILHASPQRRLGIT